LSAHGQVGAGAGKDQAVALFGAGRESAMDCAFPVRGRDFQFGPQDQPPNAIDGGMLDQVVGDVDHAGDAEREIAGEHGRQMGALGDQVEEREGDCIGRKPEERVVPPDAARFDSLEPVLAANGRRAAAPAPEQGAQQDPGRHRGQARCGRVGHAWAR
jgi:hypothetical protein